MRFRFMAALSAMVTICATATSTLAAITNEFTTLAGYNAAVGAHTVIPFTDLPVGTILSNQYAGLGVTFTEGNDEIASEGAFVADGLGVRGIDSITLSFASPKNHVGAEFPGALRIDLYNGVSLVGSSSNFAGMGSGFFGGVTSTPFNRAVLVDWLDNAVFIDNLHFGFVPEPASIASAMFAGLALAGGICGRRRRER